MKADSKCGYRVFDREIRRRMQAQGLTKESALLAYRSTMRAIEMALLWGEPVHFHGIGVLHWRLRRGRTMVGGIKFMRKVQPDSYHLKWVTAPSMARKLKGITPAKFLKPLPRPKKVPVRIAE